MNTSSSLPGRTTDAGLRRAVLVVALANLAYFIVEFGVARRIGMLLAGILAVPALALLWTAWHKVQTPTPPEPWKLSVTGLGALAVNLGCAFLLAEFRHHSGSLTRAAFLSARNDAFANVAIIAAGLVTLRWSSVWPDLVVGFGIAVMNADAAKTVWHAAHDEHAAAQA